jgi:LPXTG-site transpeptidase (sortase) family protein
VLAVLLAGAGGLLTGQAVAATNGIPGPADEGTAAPADDGTAAPANHGTAAPADDGTAAPTDDGSAGPADDGTPPPRQAGQAPKAGTKAGGSRWAPAVSRSAPVALEIPSIGLRTKVVPVGLRPDQTLEVPPLAGDSPAGWYDHSPTPGENGDAVIVGHVDSARDGPAVFYRLRLMHVGDRLAVRRADGRAVRFEVTAVRLYPKADFPADLVYGPRTYPALTLITCGGSFDRTLRSYRGNLLITTRAV